MTTRRARIFLAISVTFLLLGCDALELKRPVSDQDLSSHKHIGVVSLLGDSLHVISIGTTVFNNDKYDAPVPDWGIDAYAARTATDLLAASGKVDARDLDRGNSSAESFYIEPGSYRPDVHKLTAYAANKGLDTLVVIRKAGGENYPFMEGGYGFFKRSMFGLTGMNCVYSLFIVEVFDANSGKQLAWEWGQPNCPKNVPAVEQKMPFSAYSAAEIEQLKSNLKVQIAASLQDSIKDLHL